MLKLSTLGGAQLKSAGKPAFEFVALKKLLTLLAAGSWGTNMMCCLRLSAVRWVVILLSTPASLMFVDLKVVASGAFMG